MKAIRAYGRLLRQYLRPVWGQVALLGLLLAVSIALQLYSPQILRQFIDAVTAGATMDTLTRIALLFIGVAIVTQGVTVVLTYLGESVAWTATNTLREDLAAHLLKLDLSFHKARTPGELIERVDGDVTALANFFSQFAVQMLGNLALLVGILALMYREDWRIGVCLTLFALVALLILVRLQGVAVGHWAAVRQITAEFFGFLGERLAGTEDIRANGATGYVMRRFYELLRKWLPLQRKGWLAASTMWMATLAVFALGTATAFGVGAYLYNLGAITIGTVYMIFFYTELLRRPLEQIRTQLQDLQKAGASIGRVEELFQVQTRLSDGVGASIPAGPLSVEFEHVWFSYEDRERVLQDVSFCLEPGATLGLLGRTGSGKTTLARLLFRLYDSSSGEIRLGGVPLGDADLKTARQRVGIVTQDVQLFKASIRDNLTFFRDDISDERILAVLEDIGLGRWYRSLPLGLDTELEAEGGGLSAGEAQLLAFTRVFLKDPGLVILDEASSRLDPATEALVERAIDKLLHGRTAIIIAHRLGTVQRADQILILDQGQIVELGPRVALLSDSTSRFSQSMRTGLEEVLA